MLALTVEAWSRLSAEVVGAVVPSGHAARPSRPADESIPEQRRASRAADPHDRRPPTSDREQAASSIT
jgi:hypothetical protein